MDGPSSLDFVPSVPAIPYLAIYDRIRFREHKHIQLVLQRARTEIDDRLTSLLRVTVLACVFSFIRFTVERTIERATETLLGRINRICSLLDLSFEVGTIPLTRAS